MSQPIVLQLQEFASDGRHDISDLLRKALLVSTKLQLPEYREWILSELNGYKDRAAIPEYRIIHGDLRAENPYRGLVPFIIPDSELKELVTKIYVHESVSSIQQLASSESRGNICFHFDAEQEAALMQIQGRGVQLRPVRVAGSNKLLAIIQSVRTRILEWALSLESAGILGHGLAFSDQERSAAMTNKTIQIENFQGVLGDVNGGSVNQSNTITVISGNFDSLANYLTQQGVQAKEIKELESAIRVDPEPKSSGIFGKKVSAWVGKMVGLAASGSWEVGVATAGTLLSAALTKFYGL
jgi:hypothetical protein